jgi:hypothetical protein
MSSHIEFNTQLAWAFLKKAYIMRKKQPTIFINRYCIDWLPIMLRLFKLNADRENAAPVQPTISSMYFRSESILLKFYAKEVRGHHL